MALQQLYGSDNSQYGGAGYKILAASPEIYNYLSESDTSSSRIYDFTKKGEHPIKFCSYYNHSFNLFIQTTTSYEVDYVGRDSHISHTLMLSDEETKKVLENGNTILNPDMFMNGRSENFDRPTVDELPELEYKILPRQKVSSSYITNEDLKRLIFCILQIPSGFNNIFIILNGSPLETTYIAVDIMNLLYSILPAEYKKRIGFTTYSTNFDVYENFNIYFITNEVNLFDIPHNSYVFDLSSSEEGHQRYYGIDEELYSKSREIISCFSTNGDKNFVGYLDAILPKLDQSSCFSEDTLEEIYQLYSFTSSKEIDRNLLNLTLIEGVYKYYFIVSDSDKPLFLQNIRNYLVRFKNLVCECFTNSDAEAIYNVFTISDRYYLHLPDDQKATHRFVWISIFIKLLDEYENQNYDGRFVFDNILVDNTISSPFKDDLLNNCLKECIQNKFEGERQSLNARFYLFYLKYNLVNEEFTSYDKECAYSYICYVRDIIIRTFDNKIRQEVGAEPDKKIISFIEHTIWKETYGKSIYSLCQYANLEQLFDLVYILRRELDRANSANSETIFHYFFTTPFENQCSLLELVKYRLLSAKLESFDEIVSSQEKFNSFKIVYREISGLSKEPIKNEAIMVLSSYSKFIDRCKNDPSFSSVDLLKKVDSKDADKLKNWIKTNICSNSANMTASFFINTSVETVTTSNLNSLVDYAMLVGKKSMQEQPQNSVQKKYKFNCQGALNDYYNSLVNNSEENITEKMIEFMQKIDEFISSCGGSFPQDYKEGMARFINEVLLNEQQDKKIVKENEKKLNHIDFFKTLLKEEASKQSSGGKLKIPFPFKK